MLKPKANVKKFEEYDFKPCKGTARDNRTYLDIIYDLIKADMLESVLPQEARKWNKKIKKILGA